MAKKPSVLPTVIAVDDLDAAIDSYTRVLGYKLEMITPADSPTVAVVSGHETTIRLESSQQRMGDNGDWAAGRAGMEYRDLIPGRLGGSVIASHIRIPERGPVADYVHYHKVRFQVIYCVKGAIRVVYEDQGPPFWLSPGDCVLQPPEMRHRVLEAAGNSEVIEISSPAVHETWTDHELKLPTRQVNPDRVFGGQRFVRHIAGGSTPRYGQFGGFESNDMGIAAASDNVVSVFELRTRKEHSTFQSDDGNPLNTFYFVLAGPLTAASAHLEEHRLSPGDSFLIPPHTPYTLGSPANSKILAVIL